MLYPPFAYADPRSFTASDDHAAAYQFVVDESSIVPPSRDKDGQIVLRIEAGKRTASGQYQPTRYFALNGLELELRNDGKLVGFYRIDRRQKLGYDTTSYDMLDNPNRLVPHLITPVGEQGDVYKVGVFLPRTWFEKNQYDWSKGGTVSIRISSIWADYLDGHSHSLTLSLPANN